MFCLSNPVAFLPSLVAVVVDWLMEADLEVISFHQSPYPRRSALSQRLNMRGSLPCDKHCT